MVKHSSSLKDFIYIAEVFTNLLVKLVKLKDMVYSLWHVSDVIKN